MKQSGQAYSVFKLLIAAIVAMAVLAILIPIIMQVMGLIKANPTNETKSLISSLVDAPGSIGKTKEVSFAPGTDISGSSLSERTSISQDQICMSTGEFEEYADEGEFECLNCGDSEASQQRIIYHGTSERTVKIAVVCNRMSETTGEGLLGDIGDYKLDDGEGNSITDACTAICQPNAKCCAVVLQRA